MRAASMFNKLLVLDLDETLIYATMFAEGREPDFRVGLAYVWRRPGVQRFLATCLERFTVGIWTSATREYADDVITSLFTDPSPLAFVWTREHCEKRIHPVTQDRYWVKDLSKLVCRGVAAESIIVADDSPESWVGFQDNVVPVSKYKGDPQDQELDLLLHYLDRLGSVADVRSAHVHMWRSPSAVFPCDRL